MIELWKKMNIKIYIDEIHANMCSHKCRFHNILDGCCGLSGTVLKRTNKDEKYSRRYRGALCIRMFGLEPDFEY